MLMTVTLRRLAIVGCASALVAVTLASGGAASALPARSATINTVDDWNRSGGVSHFGRGSTPTYGQVITIPEGMTRLTRFNFYLTDGGGYMGSLVLRGEVYAWDGSKPTGPPLWEGKPRTVDAESFYRRKQFRPHGVGELHPGEQYVIFASVSKDYEECTDDYPLTWGSVPDSTYSDGTFVFINDGGDESRWTSEEWTTTWGIDLAFKAWLS
jgi:hypothetical protein